ncbi:MAG: xylulokinase [Armatimonadetes bacterium 55-13]|nr:xylulokinase [Armatimonadota bacterium]OJU62608.1 MAG: xylulokinase [Armatimonadetes bacterium 55-13]
MAKLLGIDVGTSGCKVVLMDEHGSVLKSASAEYPISTPRPLWSEQNPEDWWLGVLSCLKEIDEPSPDGVGLTGQMHGAVFLDSKNKVIRPAILWNDQRTSSECEEIDHAVGPDRIREITRNPPLTGFQLPKILWLRNNEPENFNRLSRVLLPKDYIRLRLTGEYATEVSDASGVGAFDVVGRKWSAEILDKLNLPQEMFPPVVESDVVTGTTKDVPNLADGIAVVGGGGDQAAGAVGTGAVSPGIISVSLGTSGVVFTTISAPNFDANGSAHTFAHANRGWHAMGVMLSCGGALRWYRDVFARGDSYDSIAQEAASVPPGCEGLTFLPYLTGERTPHNDPFARAVFAGATLAHGKAHFSRAVFEGVSLGLLDGFRTLLALGASAQEIRVTSGGAKSEFWRQMLADMFQAPCQRLQCDEGPAFGSAILAGVGIGLWPDVAKATLQIVKISDVLTPNSVDYSATYQRYSDLYRCTKEWNLG